MPLSRCITRVCPRGWVRAARRGDGVKGSAQLSPCSRAHVAERRLGDRGSERLGPPGGRHGLGKATWTRRQVPGACRQAPAARRKAPGARCEVAAGARPGASCETADVWHEVPLFMP